MKNECKVYPPRFISVFHDYFHNQICKNESEITSYTGAEFWAHYVPKNQYSGRILKEGSQCAEIRKPPTNRKISNFSRKYVQSDTFYPLFTYSIGQENYSFYSWLCVQWFSEGVIVEKSTYFKLLIFTRGKSTGNSWIFREYFRQIHEKGKVGNKTHSFPDVLSR